MAIIIPSKHIYHRENKKMIDNAIANISLNENIYNRNIIEMYSNANASNSSTEVHAETYIGAWGTGGEAKRVRFELECSYHKYNFSATASEAIRDDEIQLLSHITTSGNTQGENFDNYEYLIKNKETDYTVENIPLPIPASTDYSEISKFCIDLMEDKLGFEISSASDYSVSVELSYLKSIKVYLTQQTLNNGVWGQTNKSLIGISPMIDVLELSLFLNYSKVTTTAKTIGLTGLTHSLEKNELLQVGTLINGEKASNYLATQILRGYKNGKETAMLLCGINDYFDENGEKVISIDGAKNKLLPQEYQEVEYIESTGTQYIDIGETINTDTDTVELTFQATEQNMYKWVFGEHDNTARFGLGSGDGANKRNVAYGDSTYKVVDTQFYNSKHTFVSNKSGITIDNAKITNFKSFASTSTLYMFNLNLNNSDYCASAKVWGYKQTRNGKLLRNFIPCYRIADGVVGLYELVDNKFYENKGSGEFLKGKSILGETKMSFRMYDEVIPMVYTADGIDTPMSKRKDGSTKSFIVVGSNIFYDGAVFQELSLQEA